MKNKTKIAFIVLVVSLGTNIYYFGWKGITNKIVQMKEEAFKSGQLNTINILFKQLQDTGQVRIQTDDGIIILVPQTL